jgi:type III secretion control protein HpaP
MSHRVTNRARVIVAELDEVHRRARPRRDYRALLQRAKAYRLAQDADSMPEEDAQADDATAPDDALPAALPTAAMLRDAPDTSREESKASLASRRPNKLSDARLFSAPYVEALTEHHERSVRAIEWLAARVGDFCADPAVIGSGVWTTRLKLDPAVLPYCTLELMLSHFQVSLRFDVDDPSSKQLILDNKALLQARLTTMFVRLGLHRTIDIIV